MENYKQVQWEDVTDIMQLKGVSPNLTEYEWNVLNTYIEYTEARRKAASVLRYIKKYIFLNEGAWTVSFDTMHKMYKRYHKNFSLSQLKNIVNKLRDLGLIGIVIIKKKNVYTLPVARKLSKKPTEKLPIENPTGDTENADTEENSELPRLGLETENDIYTNTNNGDADTVKKSYGETVSESEALNIANQVIESLKVKSKWIINSTIQTVKDCYSNINRLGAYKYISKIILKLQAISKSVYKNTHVYSDAVKKYRTENTKKAIRFNEDIFTREYDYDDLEKKLLGWNDEYDKMQEESSSKSYVQDLLASI